eukprot:564241-Pyramimonas_sp.AAC.1
MESRENFGDWKSFLESLGGLPWSAAEALPETLPCVPARMQARVEACRKLSRTRCRAVGASARPVDR